VTKNLLELAELISGSDLFIGNQSSPGWLAMAMGHPIIQESHASIHDSMVPRRNAQYVVDGRIRII
jgi:ADP-heptose:LPS heptosyltransferase